MHRNNAQVYTYIEGFHASENYVTYLIFHAAFKQQQQKKKDREKTAWKEEV